MVLMDPPPEKPPEPKPPKMKMRGAILSAGQCPHCTGRYVLLLPEGEDKTRLMHSKPWCKQYEDDPNLYWKNLAASGVTRKSKPNQKKRKAQREKKERRKRSRRR